MRTKDSVTPSAGSQARSEGADCFQLALQRVINVIGLSSHGRDAIHTREHEKIVCVKNVCMGAKLMRALN